jgi:hypothetical protein
LVEPSKLTTHRFEKALVPGRTFRDNTRAERRTAEDSASEMLPGILKRCL